jgi:hypothetical protein
MKNTLAEVVRLPGGRTVAEALRGAASRIADLRQPTQLALLAKIDALGALSRSGRGGSASALGEIYREGNEILSLSGAVEAPEIAEAVYSLCELADAFTDAGLANWPAIDVHVDALRILSTEGVEAAAKAHILTGLRQVRARVLAV